MAYLSLFVVVAGALLLCSNIVSARIGGFGGCPPPNRVYNDKPACFSDADCQKWGQVCCRNQYNTKSCTNRAPWLRSNAKYHGVDPSLYTAGKRMKRHIILRFG